MSALAFAALTAFLNGCAAETTTGAAECEVTTPEGHQMVCRVDTRSEEVAIPPEPTPYHQ